MKIKWSVLIFTLLLVMNSTYARIGLDISIIYKKGIDNKLLLSSELHAHEDVENEEAVSVSMTNGVTANITAKFISDIDVYGPTPLIELEITLFDKKVSGASVLKSVKVEVLAGDYRTFEHQDKNGRLIVFKVKPEIL